MNVPNDSITVRCNSIESVAVATMKCPKCQTETLGEYFVEDVALDRCSTCDGIWFDAQEFQPAGGFRLPRQDRRPEPGRHTGGEESRARARHVARHPRRHLRGEAARVRAHCRGRLRWRSRRGGARPLAEARKILRSFPGIGEPGAEKVLLFSGRQALLAPDSNALRVLVRLGLVREEKSYARTYAASRRRRPTCPDREGHAGGPPPPAAARPDGVPSHRSPLPHLPAGGRVRPTRAVREGRPMQARGPQDPNGNEDAMTKSRPPARPRSSGAGGSSRTRSTARTGR